MVVSADLEECSRNRGEEVGKGGGKTRSSVEIRWTTSSLTSVMSIVQIEVGQPLLGKLGVSRKEDSHPQ